MKKTGIMGGTFNPIHIGHLLLAENAYEQLGLEKILFMPSRVPPHKPMGEVLENQKRIEMVELAIRDIPYFELSLMEMEREGVTYTVDTLSYLSEQQPDTEYYFIAGADSLYQIETWKDPGRILKLCRFSVANRESSLYPDLERQAEKLRRKYNARIELIDIPEVDISSHLIRERLRTGRSVRYLVPEPVEQYLREHRAYRGEVDHD